MLQVAILCACILFVVVESNMESILIGKLVQGETLDPKTDYSGLEPKGSWRADVNYMLVVLVAG